MTRRCFSLGWLVLSVASLNAVAQTTAGIGTTILFPVTAQTSSFTSEVTIYNPGPNALTAHVTFFEANNSSMPGTKVCTDAAVPANRSFQFSIGTQCPLAAGSHFGLLVVADSANPQSNSFYGYTRVQNPFGIGFSVEGFPVQNFNNQVSHATGLKRQAASPTYQTNCFVGSLDQAVNYELKLFNDTTGAQIGNTLTGSLNAFEQFRYLDVFGPNGVNAPAGDQFNVRAQFTQTSGGTANLIGFCTVQDNTSFGADFRIAKSYGSPSNSFFAQGGNTFGTTAKLGTLDNQPLEIYANNQRVMRYEPNATSSNVVGGNVNNLRYIGVAGASISGGGAAGTSVIGYGCVGFFGGLSGDCRNAVSDDFGTIGGGVANFAGDGDLSATDSPFATVAGGFGNTASNISATVGGGGANTASGPYSTVSGGDQNTASGEFATVPGGVLNTAAGYSSFAGGFGATNLADRSFLWSNVAATLTAASANEFIVVSTNGIGMYTFGDFSHGCALVGAAGGWSCTSDRETKSDFTAIEPRDVLARVADMPITKWRWKGEAETVRHMGPTAQDFRAAFNLGHDDKTIGLMDSEGVALAAIQGLNQIVQEKDARIAALERRLQQLERLVEALAAKP